MEIRYDSDADAMYIKLKKGGLHHNKLIDKNTILDYDVEDNILGIELLFVRERNPKLIKKLFGAISKKMKLLY